MIKIVLMIVVFIFSIEANAWVSGTGVTIENIIVWEEAETATQMYIRTSNNIWCYLPPGQKTLQSLVLTLYTTKKPIEIHCHDAAENLQSNLPAHRLHRIWTL